jgi:hypothetical protein
MVQARVQAQSTLLSLGGGPGFLIGYQGPTYALGVGVGLTRLGISTKESGNSSVSLFQISPTVLLNVWQSADGRARANLIGSVGYEHASGSVSSQSSSCIFDPSIGGTRCSNSTSTDTVDATLIPVMAGVGGDYFFSRHFALGTEAGIQAAFLTNAESSQSNGSSQDLETTGNMAFAYGVIRATIVTGD